MLSEYMESVELAVETCLDNAELGPADVDGVLMVGGSSRIPAFQELLRRYFGQEPQFSRNLDEDVARGAALMGAIKTGTAAPLSPLAALPAPVDRSSHAIGVAALNDANVLRNFVVLPANSPIPTVVPGERIFGTHQEGQDQIELIVNEGDDEDLKFVDKLGSASGDLGAPRPRGYPITVRMTLDGDGILSATAHDPNGAQICQVEVRREGAMSDRRRAEATAALDDVMVI